MTYYNDTKYSLEIRESRIPNSGKGVFSKGFIPKGTIIGEYKGKLISSSVDVKNSDYIVYLSRKYSIDAYSFPRSYMAMINDANNTEFGNNCVLKKCGKHAYVVSTENIDTNEEIYLNYGTHYWN